MALSIGDKAPDFSGIDSDGKAVNLADFKGKKVILYFYPKDMTPGCTAEACNLRDNYETLQKQGYEVLGVSADSEKSHRHFIDKKKLPFTLISDTDKNIIRAYESWGEKKFMGRTFNGILRRTFIIDENGVIENIIDKVKTKDHSAQILSGIANESN